MATNYRSLGEIAPISPAAPEDVPEVQRRLIAAVTEADRVRRRETLALEGVLSALDDRLARLETLEQRLASLERLVPIVVAAGRTDGAGGFSRLDVVGATVTIVSPRIVFTFDRRRPAIDYYASGTNASLQTRVVPIQDFTDRYELEFRDTAGTPIDAATTAFDFQSGCIAPGPPTL